MTRQDTLALLDDPLAQRLLQAATPAQFAYTWLDGTPRVVPIWFHWNGQQIILGTAPIAPKLRALAANPAVALTINTYEFPFKVLSIRGTAAFEDMREVVPEYVLMTHRLLGTAADTWLAQIQAMLPAWGGSMVRIAVTPTWVDILDFEHRFPDMIERGMATIATAT